MPVFDKADADLIANTFHDATCNIYPAFKTGTSVRNPDFSRTYTPPAAKHTGLACHVSPLVSRPLRIEADAPVVIEEIEVRVGRDEATDVTTGDVIEITAAEDAALVDRWLTVIRAEARSAALTRRFVCQYRDALKPPASAT